MLLREKTTHLCGRHYRQLHARLWMAADQNKGVFCGYSQMPAQ